MAMAAALSNGGRQMLASAPVSPSLRETYIEPRPKAQINASLFFSDMLSFQSTTAGYIERYKSTNPESAGHSFLY